jgi:hypothetical protein
MNDRYIFILISGDLGVNILHQAKDRFHMKKIIKNKKPLVLNALEGVV